MNKRTFSLCALGLVCALSVAQQQQDTLQLDEVVVTDSRFAIKRENSGKTVVKITSEELTTNQGRSLAEIINTKTGFEVNGSRSNAGQNLSYFVRGGNNRQVLVMVDGIQLNDPSQIANDFDWRLVDVSQIESIEIVKGAASTLYGSNAATAVISITTKKASLKKIAANFTTSVGTNQNAQQQRYNVTDYNNSLSVNGSLGRLSYLVGAGNQFTNGLSAVEGQESDPFNRKNANFKVGYRFSEKMDVSVFGNYDTFSADFDSAFPLQDAPFISKSEQRRAGFSSNYNYKNGSFTLNAAVNSIRRNIDSDFPVEYDAKSYVADVFNKYVFNKKWHTIVGFNYIQSEAVFGADTNFSIADPYANAVWVSGFGLNVNAGARVNNHSEYGSRLTYNFNPSYTFNFSGGWAKVFGSYSTSYIVPSLSQLFGPFGANPTLKPEENLTREIGAEINVGKLRFNALYFNRNHKNFIDFVIFNFETFEGGYVNIEEEFNTHGVEVEAYFRATQKLLFMANYAFTENKDRLFLRIPKHKANAGVQYSFSPKTSMGATYQFTGQRLDTDFSTFQNEMLSAFSMVNLNLSHTVIKNRLQLFAFVDNVLNEDYSEIIGFITRGRNGRLGFRLQF